MSTQTLDLSTLSADELKAEIKRREEAEKAEQKQAHKQYAEDKSDFLKHTSGKFIQLHNELKTLKHRVLAQANELYERMYTLQGKDPKETKSFSLKSDDDTVKVVVDRQERFEFTEEAVVHINAIRDIFRTKFEARHKAMYSILDGLLIKNSKMEYDPKLLAKARRQIRELGDDELIGEFDKLDECQRVTGTSLYCRLYIKDANNKWQDVTLQFSAV